MAYNRINIRTHNYDFINELLFNIVIAYIENMHWILFLLFSALFGVYFGHATVKHESSPVSQILLWDITTLAPLRCIIMQLSKYLKGFC